MGGIHIKSSKDLITVAFVLIVIIICYKLVLDTGKVMTTNNILVDIQLQYTPTIDTSHSLGDDPKNPMGNVWK